MPGFLRIVLPWHPSNPWVAPIALSHGSTAPLLPVGGATILAQWHRLVGNPAGVQSAYAWRGCTYGMHGAYAKAAVDFQRAGNDELEVHFRLAHVAALIAHVQTLTGPMQYRAVNLALDRLNAMAAVRHRIAQRRRSGWKIQTISRTAPTWNILSPEARRLRMLKRKMPPNRPTRGRVGARCAAGCGCTALARLCPCAPRGIGSGALPPCPRNPATFGPAKPDPNGQIFYATF